MHDLEWFKKSERAFRDRLRLIMLDNDRSYQEFEKEAIAESKPIRKPGGHEADRHDREWFWRDAFWCQDFGLDEAVQFYSDLNMEGGPSEEDLNDLFGEGGETEDGIFDWVLQVTAEEFRTLFPELKHVTEG